MPVHNLPHQSTPFVGRSRELTEIAALLADSSCRLLTILGAGGIGKTRLALQAAADQLPRFTHGVYFVPLAPLSAADQIATAIASALQVSFNSSQESHAQIVHFLRHKHILLLIDNIEHLLDGVSLLSDILQAAPDAKLLVTSRERLNLLEEWVFPLEGLLVPAAKTAAPLETFSAVQLFVQRARQVQPNFSLTDHTEAVRMICQTVEGLPLGLELAASWLRAMTCTQVAEQMSQSLDFLTTPIRNLPQRHRSLRAAFEQSWALLTQIEQAVLSRLSVFRGGFQVEAAVQVAGATLPLLAGLVDKSLIRLNADGRHDLHELLRQFAADKLSETETLAALQQHFAYFLALAQQTEAHQFGSDQVVWFDRMETELDNLRAALAWSLQNQEIERGLLLATSLRWFLTERSHWNEGLSWFERLFAAASAIPPSLHARALHNAGALSGMLWNAERAVMYIQQALDIARENHDRWNCAWALAHLGLALEGDSRQNASVLDESIALFRELNDPMGLSHSLVRRAMIATNRKDYRTARPLLEEALSIAESAGDRIICAWVYCNLGDISWRDNHDLEQTRIYYSRCIPLFREAHFYNVVIMVVIMHGHVERLLGDDQKALSLFEDAFDLIDSKLTSDIHPQVFGEVTTVVIGYASIAAKHGQPVRAATLLGAASQYDLTELSESYFEVVTFDSDLAAVRTLLSDQDFERAWAVGLAMSRDEMIAYARATKFAAETSPQPAVSQSLVEPLTSRELDVLRLLAAGYSNRAIAEQLVLTPGTVKWYVSQILGKLNASNRTQAVTQAQQLSLLTTAVISDNANITGS